MRLLKIFRGKREQTIDDALLELELTGCPLCRPLAKGASATRSYHLPNKDVVQLELLDERKNPNRKCLTLCVMDDPTMGWVEAPVKYCPRCGASLLALIKQEQK